MLPKELKEKVVEEYLSGSTLTELADKYHIVPSTVYVWVKRANKTSVKDHEVRLFRDDERHSQEDIDTLYKDISKR